ncbi:MAG: MarR family transcriptional regulator [Corynebacteriales bacterium]|nr:MarR family transcriptional regulator [Mycobacteriales bacterium]
MTDDALKNTELTFLLGMSFQLVLREFTERISAAGYPDLRPIHGFTFQALQHQGLTGTELADKLGVTKQAAGQIVDDLEARGYLLREPHPAGGRRKLITLTDKARTHLRVAGQTLHALEAEITEKLGTTDLAQLRTQLAQIIRTISPQSTPALRPMW